MIDAPYESELSDRGTRLLMVFIGLFVTLITLVGLVVLSIFGGLGQALAIIVLLALVCGWVMITLVRHRQSRQEELLLIITATANAHLPIAPALRAHLMDRPQTAHEIWVGIWSHIVVSPWYYWGWHWLNSFDIRIERLAEHLESGQKLSEALAAIPSLTTKEARIAAAIGEATGQLGPALEQADQESPAAAWAEMLPRIAYPAFLLILVSIAMTFLMYAVMPRMQKIAADFHQPLPWATQLLIHWWGEASIGIIFVVLVTTVFIMGAGILIAVPSLGWYVPGINWFYRAGLKGLILRSLGTTLALGRTIPQAIELLLDVGQLPMGGARRLGQTLVAVKRGEPFANALRDAGLIPANMFPLVRTAERTHVLPWTLRELGTILSNRSLRRARRVSIVAGPLAVIGVGAMVAVVAIGMFMPLVQWMEALSE
ncbi:MAG: type II secretion system F family protein [Gemmataceae bacterium]